MTLLENGYIKLHRSLLKWEWYEDIKTTRLFMHLLLTVNYADERWKGNDVKRGQRITSLSTLSKETGLSVQSIRTSMNRLISTGEVTSQSTSKYTIVSVNNYDCYQQDNTQDNKRATNEQQTSNNKGRKLKKAKEDKEDILSGTKDVPDRPAAITLTLNDKTEFEITDSHVSEWAQLYPAVDVMQELRKMKGWLNSNPKRRKTKSGILKFVNGWLSREQDRGHIIAANEPPARKYRNLSEVLREEAKSGDVI